MIEICIQQSVGYIAHVISEAKVRINWKRVRFAECITYTSHHLANVYHALCIAMLVVQKDIYM